MKGRLIVKQNTKKII